MKTFWLPILLLCSGCAALTADPWDWLADPGAQAWQDVRIVAHGREISFSIPDRSRSGGKHPRVWPPVAEGQSVQEILVPLEGHERSLTVGQYIWDQWWGGYFKESGHDFSLNVRIENDPEVENLLDLTVAERTARPIEYRQSVYSGEDMHSRKFREYFFDRFWVKPFRSETGLIWVAQNNPAVTEDHIYYTIPVSDRHTLKFSFFVRDKRYDWKDDPDWNASRWALVEKIMNTVRITPAPFPDERGGEPAD